MRIYRDLQSLTFATGSRTLSESASSPHEWWLSVQWQVSARGDPSIPVGCSAPRTRPLRCPPVQGGRRKHRWGGGGGRGEGRKRNRRRSRRRVFYWDGERTCEREKKKDGTLGQIREDRRGGGEAKIGTQTWGGGGGEKRAKEGGKRWNVEIQRIGGRQWVRG